MTNTYDVDHGLSQVHLGANEPLEVAQQSPGIRVEVEPDPRGLVVGVWEGSRCVYSGAHAIPDAPACLTCNNQGAVGNILNAEPCPDCAAPAAPVSTVEQAGHCCERAQAQGIAVCDECVRENENLVEAVYGAPAAGDAQNVDPLQGAANWLVQAHGQPSPIILSGCLMIGYNRAQRLYDAAIAAQRKEDA